jgi:hypothetical protein
VLIDALPCQLMRKNRVQKCYLDLLVLDDKRMELADDLSLLVDDKRMHN